MKTIFITSFHGLVSRVLASGVLDYLKKEDIKIVIFVPDFKKDYFVKNFSDNNVVIESIDRSLIYKRNMFFHKLSFLLLNTKTMRIIRKSFRGYKYYYQFLTAQFIASFLGRWKIIRKLFRVINYYFIGDSIFDKYFEKYNPDMILSMDVKDIFDTQLIIEAKKKNIFTVGMVRSWDYLTAKGSLRVLPNKLVVHNEVIKKEASMLADMKEEDIFIVGMPHFDPYVNNIRLEKNEFFRKINADVNKPLLFLAPMGDKFADIDWEIFDMLCSAIKDKKLPDLNVLVRVPPGDTVNIDKFNKCENILLDYPGLAFENQGRKTNEMTFDDLLHLADSIYYSSVVVTSPSTICIDAAAFNKPIIFLGFDGKEKKNYYQSHTHIYDFNHMSNVVKLNGSKMAKSKEELIEYINNYLNDPKIDEENRKKIVEQQCWRMDGNSSKRFVDYILSFLK